MARDPTVFVHPRALCESDDVGPRTRVWAFAHVLSGARIGADGNVGGHAFVEGGVVVGDRVTIKNGVLLFAGVTVEDEVFLGPGAVFTNDTTPRAAYRKGPAGRRATPVAGAPPRVPPPPCGVATPARQTGWPCRCGRTLPETLECPGCGRAWRLGGGGTLTSRGAPNRPRREGTTVAHRAAGG